MKNNQNQTEPEWGTFEFFASVDAEHLKKGKEWSKSQDPQTAEIGRNVIEGIREEYEFLTPEEQARLGLV